MAGTKNTSDSDSDLPFYDCLTYEIRQNQPSLSLFINRLLDRKDAEAFIQNVKKNMPWWRYFLPYPVIYIDCDAITDNFIAILDALQESLPTFAGFKTIRIYSKQIPSDMHQHWLNNAAHMYHRPICVQCGTKEVFNSQVKNKSRFWIRFLSRLFASLTILLLTPFLVGFYLLGKAIWTYFGYKSSKLKALLDLVQETSQPSCSLVQSLFNHRPQTAEHIKADWCKQTPNASEAELDERLLHMDFANSPEAYLKTILSVNPSSYDYNYLTSWLSYMFNTKDYRQPIEGRYSYGDEQYLRCLYYVPKKLQNTCF